MRGRLITLLVAVCAAVAGLAAPAPAARPAVRVMTFNICGNVCRGGEVAATAGNVAYQVRARHVGVALLQEVCYTQFLGVRARLAKYGYRAAFGRAASGGRCNDVDRAHGTGFGVALFVKGALTGVAVRRLPSPYGVRPEGRVLLAGTARIGGRTVYVAGAHTAPGGPNLAVQMNAIRAYLTPIAAARPVIFGGDLNSLPDNPALDGFYGPANGGTGVFGEANGTRVNPLPTFATVPRKIDYLFASRRFFTARGAAVAATRYSDHRMYLGTFG
jgi:endonuclease/exonuclease/phosphatase family metal-dependent hydrolase